jgi:hypothetical protein
LAQNPVPLLQAKGCLSSGRAGRNSTELLRTPRPRYRGERNGDEHAWSTFRINQRLAEASRREGRPGKASIDTRLSGLGISCGQSSRRQKLAEIFKRDKQDKTHMPTAIGLIQQQASRGSK